MQRVTLFGLLLFLGSTALAPCLTYAAGDGKPDSGDIGKLLDERLNNETADGAKQEQLALAKAKRQGVITEGNAVLKDMDTLQATVERWESQMNALLTNAEGQALATDPVNVEHFIDLQQVERYSLSQVEGTRSEVQTLLTPIQTASDNSLSVPGDAVVTEIRNKSKEVKVALDQYAKLQSKLNVLLQKTKGIQVTTGSPILAATIRKVEEDQAQREIEIRQIANNKAQHEANQRIAEEEAKKVQAETELKLQIIQNETKRLEEEKKAKKQEAEDQQLVAEATSKATLSRFQPFLAPGSTVLARNTCRWGTDQSYKGPVSYSDILKCHTLDDLKWFVAHGTHPSNDRPKWNTPNSDQEWREMKERLKDFKRYAPIWQQQGLLAP